MKLLFKAESVRTSQRLHQVFLLTLLGERVRNIKVVVVEVQQLDSSVQSEGRLVDLLWDAVDGDLRDDHS